MWNLVPDGILVLLVGMNISNLEDEDAVVVNKVMGLPGEGFVPADSNMPGTATVNPPDKKWHI